jgi:tetratricopeptide (TPR) repeat protein
MAAPFQAIAAFLILSAAAGGSRCPTAAGARPQDALVLVTSYSRQGCMSSHGLVVGAGSLVVAFYPAVFEEFSGGRHRLAKGITVASPFRGDIVDAEIVASAARQRLALLRVPWRGHPALQLAADKDIANADRMTVIGVPRIIEVLSGKSRSPVEPSGLFQETTAGVEYVAVRAGKPSFVLLQSDGGLSSPWAGAPVLLPGTDRVAATVSFLFVNGAAEVGVLNRMEELANRVRDPEPVTARAAEPGASDDARAVFLLSVRIGDLLGHKQYEETIAECRTFIELRPNCFYGYIYAARAAEELKQVSEADRLYQEAVTRSPDSAIAKVSYAAFLERQDRMAEAIQVLESLWPRRALRPYVSNAISTLLTQRHEHNRCIRFLEEALAVDPNNAHALIGLGNNHNALQEYAAAADAFGKAAALWPDHDAVRAHYARNLELAGRLDEAEVQYRKAMQAHPENEFGHHSFASFLAHHRPERGTEALHEARAALGVHDGSTADRAKVERLIRDLEAQEP